MLTGFFSTCIDIQDEKAVHYISLVTLEMNPAAKLLLDIQ